MVLKSNKVPDKETSEFDKSQIDGGKEALQTAESGIEGITTSDQALARAIGSLSSKVNMELLTDLQHGDEVKLLSALSIQAQKLHPKKPGESVIGLLVKHYPEYRVSHKRKGRDELFGIAKAIKEDQTRESRMKRMLKFW